MKCQEDWLTIGSHRPWRSCQLEGQGVIVRGAIMSDYSQLGAQVTAVMYDLGQWCRYCEFILPAPSLFAVQTGLFRKCTPHLVGHLH